MRIKFVVRIWRTIDSTKFLGHASKYNYIIINTGCLHCMSIGDTESTTQRQLDNLASNILSVISEWYGIENKISIYSLKFLSGQPFG